jgi:putative ABC transport system permease protein
MTVPLSYTFRNLSVRAARTAATALGIAMVVFVLAASRMLARGIRETMIGAGRPDRAMVMQLDTGSEGGSRVRRSVLGVAAAAPGVRRDARGMALATGESIVHISAARANDARRLTSVQVRGVEANVFDVRPEVRIVQGRAPRPGSDEAMVGAAVVGTYEGLGPGGQFELKKGRPIQIVGVFAAGGTVYDSEIWTDLNSLLSALSWEGSLASVTVQLESSEAFDDFARALTNDRAQALSVERETQYYERVSMGLTGVVGGLGTLIAALLSLGALLGAAITMHAAVAHRSTEIGVLRAIGFGPIDILVAFVVEATLLASIGGVLGVVLAVATHFIDFSMQNPMTGHEIVFHFLPTLPISLQSILAGALLGLFGGLFPAVRAARLNPVLTLRA